MHGTLTLKAMNGKNVLRKDRWEDARWPRNQKVQLVRPLVAIVVSICLHLPALTLTFQEATQVKKTRPFRVPRSSKQARQNCK